MNAADGQTSDTLSRRLPRNVRLLGWASLLNDVASEAIYPLLPLFLLGLGGSRTLLGFLEGLADTTASLLKFWAGTWSDRLGRRKTFIVVGYALAGLSRPCLSGVTRLWQVFIIRLLDRIGKGVRTAPRDAMIAESTTPQDHGNAFGYHRAMDHLGAAIGPALASLFLWWQPDGLRALMLLSIVPGILVLVLQTTGLTETTRGPASGPLQEPFSGIPTGQFRRFLISLLFFTLANSSDAFLLVRAEELGVAAERLPLLWAMLHVLKSAGNRLGGQLADHYSPRRLIIGGWLLYAFLYFAFGSASREWHVWALFAIYAAFYALTEPAEKKLVAELAPKGQTGAAFGWFHTILGIANLPSSLLFGYLYQSFGPFVAFLWGAAMAILSTAILLTMKSPRQPASNS